MEVLLLLAALIVTLGSLDLAALRWAKDSLEKAPDKDLDLLMNEHFTN
jgi:hypothetical protein